MGAAPRARVAPTVDQELEVRARLYAKPPPTERTVEVLGPLAASKTGPPPSPGLGRRARPGQAALLATHPGASQETHRLPRHIGP